MTSQGGPRKSQAEMKVIYHGATVTDIGAMFGFTPQEVNARIAGRVTPVEVEGRNPRYRVRDVAPYLVNPVFDVEEFLRNMTPAKLPPALQDAFWKAQKNRQDFEEEKGDLWRTSRVVEVMGDVFKSIRMSVMMLTDTVERSSELTPKQRAIIIEVGDSFLKYARQKLKEDFEPYVPPNDEHGRPLDEEAEPPMMSVPTEDPEFDDGF